MSRTIVGVACALALAAAMATTARTQSRVRTFVITGAAASADARATDSVVTSLLASGDVIRVHQEQDPLVPARMHERLRQVHRGVPIWGADVTRQSEDGRLVSLFGEVHERIDVDTTPRVAADAAKATVEGLAGAETGRKPELIVLPLDGGGYRLAWTLRVLNSEMRRMRYFLDARTGELLRTLDETTTQSAVGTVLA